MLCSKRPRSSDDAELPIEHPRTKWPCHSTSVRIRTPCGSFGGCVLSQERRSCADLRREACRKNVWSSSLASQASSLSGCSNGIEPSPCRHAESTTPRTPCKTSISGRSGSRTRKELAPPTGFQPAPGTHREAPPYFFSASTRTRTRNVPLEAGYDLRFTIEARHEQFVVQRKARDSNPHLPRGRATLAVRSGQPYPATFRIQHSSEFKSGLTGSRTRIAAMP